MRKPMYSIYAHDWNAETETLIIGNVGTLQAATAFRVACSIITAYSGLRPTFYGQNAYFGVEDAEYHFSIAVRPWPLTA